MTATLQHYELTAEWVDDKQGTAVMLTQADPFSDNPDTDQGRAGRIAAGITYLIQH